MMRMIYTFFVLSFFMPNLHFFVFCCFGLFSLLYVHIEIVYPNYISCLSSYKFGAIKQHKHATSSKLIFMHLSDSSVSRGEA